MGLNIIPANAVDVLSFSASPCKGHLFITVSLSGLYTTQYSHVQECRNRTSLKASTKEQDTFIPLRNSTQARDSTPCCGIPGLSRTYLDTKCGHSGDAARAPFRGLQWDLWAGWKCTLPFHYFFKPMLSLSFQLLWNDFKIANVSCFGNLCKH